MRKISNLFGGIPIQTIKSSDVKKLKYHEITRENEWRVDVAKLLIDIKYDQYELIGFKRKEIDEMLEFICTT